MGGNSDIIKSGYEAFGRQDIPAVLAVFDPGIVWYSPDSVRSGGTFKGHDEVVGFFMKLPESYQDIHVTPRQYVEQGDTVVVIGTHTGKGAGGSFEEPFVHVWTFKDGKATSFTEWFDTVKMAKAIG